MEVSVSSMETARPIFLASTCGILSQDRRHKFIPLDSLLVLHQSHRSVHGARVGRFARFVSFTLVHAAGMAGCGSRMHANGPNAGTLRPINKSRPRVHQRAPFSHNNEKTSYNALCS